MPYQVSVFAENKPGKIERITSVLAKNNINICAITISDSGDYGIIKLLVNNPELCADVLKEAGFAAILKEVVALRLPDRVGSLAEVAAVLSNASINAQDAYGYITHRCHEAVFVFQVEQVKHVESILSQNGYTVLTDSELYML